MKNQISLTQSRKAAKGKGSPRSRSLKPDFTCAFYHINKAWGIDSYSIIGIGMTPSTALRDYMNKWEGK